MANNASYNQKGFSSSHEHLYKRDSRAIELILEGVRQHSSLAAELKIHPPENARYVPYWVCVDVFSPPQDKALFMLVSNYGWWFVIRYNEDARDYYLCCDNWTEAFELYNKIRSNYGLKAFNDD